jgi:hypothetical protein
MQSRKIVLQRTVHRRRVAIRLLGEPAPTALLKVHIRHIALSMSGIFRAAHWFEIQPAGESFGIRNWRCGTLL